MSDASGIRILQDERTPPGHAIIRVSGVEQAPLDEHFEIRRAEDHGVPVGTDWPTGPRDPVASNWDPETKVWEMTIGPEIVNPILGGTRVVVNLLGLGRQEQLSWPDDLVLAVAGGRRWARPTRREIKTVVPPGKDTTERDRRRQAEAEAQRRQEEQRQQAEAERRRQQEEEQRRSAETERQRRDEESRRQAEAEQQKSEAEKRSREEEERKQAESDRQQRLDEERRAAEEKQKRLDEEKTRALDERKRDDDRRGSENRLGLWLGLTGRRPGHRGSDRLAPLASTDSAAAARADSPAFQDRAAASVFAPRGGAALPPNQSFRRADPRQGPGFSRTRRVGTRGGPVPQGG